MYKDLFGKRVEYNPKFKYFSHFDFEGLEFHESCFKLHGKRMYGGFYFKKANKYNGVVIFSHGFGAGHKAYMAEINYLANANFIVYAYDNYGTASSLGDSIRSASESVRSLDQAFKHVRKIKQLKNYKINLMGHSMGGYSVGVYLSQNHLISHAVILSAPNLFIDSFAKLNNNENNYTYRYFESTRNGHFANIDLVTSLNLTKSNTLLIYGEKDPIIKKEEYGYIKSHVNNKHVEFLLLESKMHNPNYSFDAIAYQVKTNVFNDPLIDTSKIDFKKVCELDLNVMKKIEDFLKK